jgi:hypothetical protein
MTNQKLSRSRAQLIAGNWRCSSKKRPGAILSVRFVAKGGIPQSSAGDTAKSAESFNDDPLIQEAIEMFNAQIKP